MIIKIQVPPAVIVGDPVTPHIKTINNHKMNALNRKTKGLPITKLQVRNMSFKKYRYSKNQVSIIAAMPRNNKDEAI